MSAFARTEASSAAARRYTVFPEDPAKRYDLVVGAGVLDSVPLLVRELCGKKGGRLGQVVVVTDVNVHRLWCKPLVGAFQHALGTTPPIYVIPAGEGSKSRETKSRPEG